MKLLRPPHFSWATPYIALTHFDTSLHFYEQAFGFILKEKMNNEHAELLYNDQILMFRNAEQDTQLLSKSGISLYLYCENVDTFYTHALSKGAISITPPENMAWGDTLCRLQCPENYTWAFATYSGVCHNQK